MWDILVLVVTLFALRWEFLFCVKIEVRKLPLLATAHQYCFCLHYNLKNKIRTSLWNKKIRMHYEDM